MKRRGRGGKQSSLFIPSDQVAQGPGHPFYKRLNELLGAADFDRFVEDLCEPFYAKKQGRPSIPPGVYFRMLLIGFFEGIDSERGIAWRCADSLGLREFLGYDMTESTPNHSTLSVIRNRLDMDTHKAVFSWVLKRVAEHGLLKGKTLGVDATTLEANAAMRSIVRRDSGESYEEYLIGLLEEVGVEDPDQDDIARLDRKRKNKASNKDWKSPVDPDARIAKMKDGRTHLAHKAEHAVDMETGVIVSATLQGTDLGDTTTIHETLAEAAENLRDVTDDETVNAPAVSLIEEVVADKGYHSNDVLGDLAEAEIRTYISEPDRGRRRWKGKERARRAVHGNRRRSRGRRGKALLRQRGELLERPFAHCFETGGMRRTHLRTHEKILKRLLIHTAGFNLARVMEKLIGIGKPRRLWENLGLSRDLARLLRMLFTSIWWSGARFHGLAVEVRCERVRLAVR
jgi:transposase